MNYIRYVSAIKSCFRDNFRPDFELFFSLGFCFASIANSLVYGAQKYCFHDKNGNILCQISVMTKKSISYFSLSFWSENSKSCDDGEMAGTLVLFIAGVTVLRLSKHLG